MGSDRYLPSVLRAAPPREVKMNNECRRYSSRFEYIKHVCPSEGFHILEENLPPAPLNPRRSPSAVNYLNEDYTRTFSHIIHALVAWGRDRVKFQRGCRFLGPFVIVAGGYTFFRHLRLALH